MKRNRKSKGMPRKGPLTVSRRGFMQGTTAVAAAYWLGPVLMKDGKALAQIPGGTLSPLDVPKYATPLVKPPAMPGRFRRRKNKYTIAMRQFQQRILPPNDVNGNPLPPTTVWSYGARGTGPAVNLDYSLNPGGTFFYPAFTIESEWNKQTSVTWHNELVDKKGNYLPHLLPVDQTLHWANPPAGNAGRDTRGTDPTPYTGPVPMIVHVHGAHTSEDYDGYPEAWYLPALDQDKTPAGYAINGSRFDYFKAKNPENDWEPGAATFKYQNDQRATTLWYHDHTLGMTRVNVYAGPAGFYLIRGGPDDEVLDAAGNKAVLPGPAPGVGDHPLGEYGEIPLAIQDRSFNVDGSLFYPDNREFFDGYKGATIPDPGTEISPIWNPEFFGNMMLVNGFTWPALNVQRKRYRFRLLNGCNSRFLLLKMTTAPRSDNMDFNLSEGKFWQIGAEGGFLAAPIQLDQVLMSPAERADVIVDFAQFPSDVSEVYLVNDGPDAPFGGISTEDISDWESTGQVMKFVLAPGIATDDTTDPAELVLPPIVDVGPPVTTRHITLNEVMHEDESGEYPVAALLGDQMGNDPDTNQPLLWMSPVTENPQPGDVEEWRIYNYTGDAHPIHIHLVQFQVTGRTDLDGDPSPSVPAGTEPWESGFKDTVICYPEEITTVKARFDKAGIFVWHCHIVEHEDNEMMRPYVVGAIPAGL